MFQNLIKDYSDFHVIDIVTNRFQPEKFHQVLESLRKSINIEVVGQSVENRPIKMISIGSGPIKVLMWTQMHGNESTATRAILDLINFHNDPTSYKSVWGQVLEKATIYIIPILNPDGTARFQRRNALEVDLNRDARDFMMPESQVLRKIMSEIKPDYSFNLHDQRRFYNIEGTGKPSTISFLGPAFNKEEQVNETRELAMKLIASMREDLETIIPGQVGLYDDSYSPRAFGDYSQEQGSSTILIESGWESYDFEKEEVRKLNFALLVSALVSITTERHIHFSEEDYRSIPMNDEKLFDVLIRRARISHRQNQYKVDIGLRREEFMIADSSSFYSEGQLEDIGDLKEWYGFDDIDASELLICPGKVLSLPLDEWTKLDEEDKLQYLKEGYLFLKVNELPKTKYTLEKINIVSPEFQPESHPVFEGRANFLLIDKAGEIKYLAINGFLWPIHEAPPEYLNGLVIN